MATMKDAMRRLQVINEACNPKDNDEVNPAKDEFTRIKKQISENGKAARELIKERESIIKAEKVSKNGIGSGTETAQLSFKIRTTIKAIKLDIEQIDQLVRKAEKKIKGKNKPEIQEIIDSRKEIVKLCQQHLDEIEHLDKARFNDKLAGDRVNLFSGGTTGSPSKLNFNKFNPGNAVAPSSASGGGVGGGQPAELPDIEVAEDLAMIRQRNMDIDQELNEITAGMQVLKQIAINMGEEVDKQNEMLEQVEVKVDKANEHVQNTNMKMKIALDNVMKGDRFLVNCILICMLLALVAYISSVLVV